MSTLKFKIAAKTNVGMVRDNNEDNFIVNPDLATEEWFCSNDDTLRSLSEPGLLLSVADGMGGAEAGEVASKLAVDAIRAYFNELLAASKPPFTPEFIANALVEVLHYANQAIVDHALNNPSTSGMGTTMILGWLYEQTLHIGWIGDSRAYLFRRAVGLVPASEDHSYVQELVNAGKLSYEESFYHPDSNIITQSLGNPKHELKPQTVSLEVGQGDLLLLCSDGLNGMLNDEDLGALIAQHRELPSPEMADLLIAAANEAGGADNITVGLIYVEAAKNDLTGVHPKLFPTANEMALQGKVGGSTLPAQQAAGGNVAPLAPPTGRGKKWKYLALTLLAVLIGLAGAYWYFKQGPGGLGEVDDKPGLKDSLEQKKSPEGPDTILLDDGAPVAHHDNEVLPPEPDTNVEEEEIKGESGRTPDPNTPTGSQSGPSSHDGGAGDAAGGPPQEGARTSPGHQGGLTRVPTDEGANRSLDSLGNQITRSLQQTADGDTIGQTIPPQAADPGPITDFFIVEVKAREDGGVSQYYYSIEQWEAAITQFNGSRTDGQLIDCNCVDIRNVGDGQKLVISPFDSKESAKEFIDMISTAPISGGDPLENIGTNWYKIKMER